MSESDDSGGLTSGTVNLQFTVTHALVLTFAIGVLVGGAGMAAVSAFAGPTGAVVQDGGSDTQPTGSQDSGSDSGTSTVETAEITTEGEPVLGASDAPVTLVMYEDFQCPFCKRFETNTFPKIKKNYVDTGKVKVVWKDFPLPQLGHDWAEPAAAAMECVYREDEAAFWTAKDKLFAARDGSITTGNVQDQVISWAEEEGVSASAVNTCLDQGSPMDEVSQDRQDGQSFDVTVGPRNSPFVGGTPSFVIYESGADSGTPIVGAQPYSRFESVIDSKLG